MLDKLIDILSAEKGEKKPQFGTEKEKAEYFRSLCNVRPPQPVSAEFLELQDQYLKAESLKRGIVDATDFVYQDAVALWQGDITRLNSDAIVNACNSALLGCFHPLHNCIDNIIHSRAGVQVRLDCDRIMQGSYLPNGEVVVTPAYNLPSQYIFHTVGPVVQDGKPSKENEADLKKCYLSCLDKAGEMNLKTIAFCCLSTGVYGYPKHLAAKAAVDAVREWQDRNRDLNIIFNVFLDEDKHHYEHELSR